jgi:TPR repeat protein
MRDAQINLGFMYDNGQGVSQDYVLVYMWFSLAAAGGDKSAGKRRRDIAASKMTPKQIAEAERLAREWKPKSKTQ